MRITGGTFRGRNIEAPSSHSDLIRPSKDIVREAIFNIIDIPTNALVLDLYAGTGILGFEALSRGARHVDFVEKMRDFVDLIRKNAINLNVDPHVDVYTERVELFLKNPHSQKYDIVFLDPPYKHNAFNDIDLTREFIDDNGILMYLHSNTVTVENEFSDNWLLVDTRTYGKTTISFCKPK